MDTFHVRLDKNMALFKDHTPALEDFKNLMNLNVTTRQILFK